MVQAPELVGAAGMNGLLRHTRSDLRQEESQQTQRYEARLWTEARQLSSWDLAEISSIDHASALDYAVDLQTD